MRTLIIRWVGTAILTMAVLATMPARSAVAQGWRCDDPPGEAECQEALINDIEDIFAQDWDTGTIDMPPIPYSCSRPNEPRDFQAEPNATVSGNIPWSMTLNMNLLSFLIGRSTAHADMNGSIRARSTRGNFDQTWTNQTSNFLFAEGTVEVMADGGSTGVYDLGSFQATLVGAFWSAKLPLDVDLVDGNWTCAVGPPGSWIIVEGRDGFRLNYPVPASSARNLIAEEVVREQFRRAVRVAVTGEP